MLPRYWAWLKAALGPALLDLEHYGSTSVTGLKAKPILDMLAGVKRLEEAPRLAAPLATLGYNDAGAEIVAGHYIFGKGADRTHLLHVVEYRSAVWNEALKFRASLRADAALEQKYEELKVRLSRRCADCRAEYTASRAAFIQSVLDQK